MRELYIIAARHFFEAIFEKILDPLFFLVEQCKIRQIKATSPLFVPRQKFADEHVHGLDHVVLHKPTPTSDAPGISSFVSERCIKEHTYHCKN